MNGTELFDKALEYAKKCHSETGHLYDGQPYIVHVLQVASFCRKYLETYVDKKYWDTVMAACFCHDVIEDCRQTYNEVLGTLGNEHAANIIYALTNEKGKTRADRANSKYFQGIRSVSYATFVKLCDRLANVKYSKENGGRMLEVYRAEQPDFKKHLDYGDYQEMWKELESLLSIN